MAFLTEKLVAFHQHVDSAEMAIKNAGQLLVDTNQVEPRYVEAMVQSYRENGAYFVIAPKVAIPHARFENGVKEKGVSLITLAEPIVFGHPTNDPVSLVFALAATSNDGHLDVIRDIVQLLNKPENIEQLIQAEKYADIRNILEELV